MINPFEVANVNVLYWGKDNHPVLVIDDFHTDPEQLVSSVNSTAVFSHQSNDLYPGVRAPADNQYVKWIKQKLNALVLPILKHHGHIASSATLNAEPFCLYSMANLPATKLLPIQCIPHFDTVDEVVKDSDFPTQWALVHYLFDAPLGGTGFFCHRSSGLEAINTTTLKRYQRTLKDDIYKLGRPKQAFLQTQHLLFSLETHVEATFNRAVLYPAHVLHSGLVDEGNIMQFGQQRLTGNALMTIS